MSQGRGRGSFSYSGFQMPTRKINPGEGSLHAVPPPPCTGTPNVSVNRSRDKTLAPGVNRQGYSTMNSIQQTAMSAANWNNANKKRIRSEEE